MLSKIQNTNPEDSGCENLKGVQANPELNLKSNGFNLFYLMFEN